MTTTPALNDDHRCPICAETMNDGDLCATDIEMGTCHAACLDGSPIVNLETGEPSPGPLATFRYVRDPALNDDLVRELRDVANQLMTGAIERADLDGMAISLQMCAAALKAQAKEIADRPSFVRNTTFVSLNNAEPLFRAKEINEAGEMIGVSVQFDGMTIMPTDHYENLRALAAENAALRSALDWQPMETAPKGGMNVVLAIPTGPFVYAIQGSFMAGHWLNAAAIEAEPLCWRPARRIPNEFLPWTDEFKAARTHPHRSPLMDKFEQAREAQGQWRYEICYGPNDEENYAFVYDADSGLVSNLKTHHAKAVVDAMNAALSRPVEGVKGEPVAWISRGGNRRFVRLTDPGNDARWRPVVYADALANPEAEARLTQRVETMVPDELEMQIARAVRAEERVAAAERERDSWRDAFSNMHKQAMRAEARLAQAEGGPAVTEAWHVVFDGFPAPEGPRFIEVEDGNGKSVSAGEWRKRDDGLCELVMAGPSAAHDLVTSAYHFVKEHYEPSDDAEFDLFKRLEAALQQSAAGEEGKP